MSDSFHEFVRELFAGLGNVQSNACSAALALTRTG
jgi:hypothetical protein